MNIPQNLVSMLEQEQHDRHEAKNKTIESLRAQNAELLVVIESLRGRLQELVKYMAQPYAATQAYEDLLISHAEQALAISPSAELLEARDRKRDAKLLRAAAMACDAVDDGTVSLHDLAATRESGSWQPKLGD